MTGMKYSIIFICGLGSIPIWPTLAQAEHREPHHQRDDVQRIGTRQVGQPQERGAPELDGVLEHEEEREQDRHGQQHGPAAAQRIHPVLLVQLEHLLLQPLRIVLVPLLNLLHERLHRLHLHVGPHRLLVQRPEQQPHQQPEDDEHEPVAQAAGARASRPAASGPARRTAGSACGDRASRRGSRRRSRGRAGADGRTPSVRRTPSSGSRRRVRPAG